MASERYVLATGAAGAERLRIVHSVHGPDTEAFLLRAGLTTGLRVADIGCGVGIISCWLAEQVGPGSEVVGVDISAEQVATAQATAKAAGMQNVRFVQAGAYETGLERESFDLVFSRFMLMHIQRPEEAIAEMRALLKPGGVLAVEDGDFSAPFCYPPSAAFDRCFELYRQIGARHGADFDIGLKLYGLVCAAGFTNVQAALAQPAYVRGEAKRLPDWTIAESAPVLISEGLTTQAEVEKLVTEMAALAEDENTLFGMARMTQVWARK
jgi:SAM-dependent methyltransferase